MFSFTDNKASYPPYTYDRIFRLDVGTRLGSMSRRDTPPLDVSDQDGPELHNTLEALQLIDDSESTVLGLSRRALMVAEELAEASTNDRMTAVESWLNTLEYSGGEWDQPPLLEQYGQLSPAAVREIVRPPLWREQRPLSQRPDGPTRRHQIRDRRLQKKQVKKQQQHKKRQ